MAKADILQLLKPLSHPSVDAALAAALPSAAPVDAQRIALALLERRPSQATTALIDHYHRLPAEARQQIVSRAWSLQTAIRTASRKTHTQPAANAVEVIGQAGLSSMAYLATALVRNGDAPRQEAGAQCLLHLAQRCGHAHGHTQAHQPDPPDHCSDQAESKPPPRHATAVSSGDRLAIAAAVREAVVHYHQHGYLEVLRALLVMLPNMPRALSDLTDLFDNPCHAAVEPLQHMLRSGEPGEATQALLPALRLNVLAESAQAGLGQAVANARLDQALTHHQVLGMPGIRPALASITEPGQMCPNPTDVESWTENQQQGLVRWLANLPLGRNEHIEQLDALAEHLQPRPRMAVVRRLIELSQDHTNDQGPQAESEPAVEVDGQEENRLSTDHGSTPAVDPAREALARYAAASNADSHSASAALDALQAVQYPAMPTVLSNMLNASGSQVRQMAAQRLAPGVFEKLWRNWPQMTRPQQAELGNVWLKLDDQWHQRLQEKLVLGDRRPVLRAMEMVRRLKQQAAFNPQMIRLARSADPSIAAAAQRMDDDDGPVSEQADSGENALSATKVESGLDYHDRTASSVSTAGAFAVISLPSSWTLAQGASKTKEGQDEGRIARVTPESVSRSLQDGVGISDPGPMILALTLVLLGLGLIQLVRGWRMSDSKAGGPTTLSLFHRAGHAVGLSWLDQWLLWRVSRYAGLPTPLTLLLSRGTLMHYGRHYARSRRLTRPGRIQKRIRKTSATLFAADEGG